METYNKADVDKILAEHLDFQEDALLRLKEAGEKCASLEAELEASKSQNAVYLEKIASAEGQPPTSFDQEQLNSTLKVLVDGAYLDEAEREKFASEIQEDPSRLLSIVNKVITLSLAPHDAGQGVKRAFYEEPEGAQAKEDKAWDKVLNEGA